MRLIGLLGATLVALALPGKWASGADTQTLSEVDVEQGDGTTRIVLGGLRNPVYTAFLREDPPRLVIELSEVKAEGVTSPIAAGGALVGDVQVEKVEDTRLGVSMTRVTVNLVGDVDHTVTPDGTRLVVELRARGAGGAAASPPAALAPSAPVPVPVPKRDVRPAAAANAATASRRIVRVAPAPDGVVVHTDGSGPAPKVESFALEAPPRLVVDIFGVLPARSAADVATPAPGVDRARIGRHPDKTRVVLDLTGKAARHRVDTTDGEVAIHVEVIGAEAVTQARIEGETGRGAAPADPRRPAAGEPAPREAASDAPAPDESQRAGESQGAAGTESPRFKRGSGPARVTSAHFESLPEHDRIVVAIDDAAEAKVVEPDPNTLIVRIVGATIAPEVERRVDTREFRGTVEIFSIFQAPDTPEPEVRIVLKRRTPERAELLWVGGQLHVQLARTEAPAAATSEGFEAIAGAPGDTVQPFSRLPEPVPAAPSGLPGAPTALGPGAAGTPSLDDPFLFDGPADPASIDILQEGGFTDDKEYSGRRISLDFKDADIGNILRLIAEVSDLNVIAGEEVTGTVTIRLVDVPWDQALDVILLTKGLGFVRVGNVLRIAPLETIKLESEQRLAERRAKERLEDLVVKLQPVNYATAKDVRDLVKRLLSKRGSVDIDARTNTLIIKDIPSVVQEATALVKAIDTQTPQVLIEAKIVEANLSFSRSLGTVWGLGYDPLDGTGGSPDFRFGNDNDVTTGIPGGDGVVQRNNFVSTTPAAGNITGLLTLGILSLDDHLQLDLQIQAAEDNNKGKVISSPRVVTLDNREATIKQGVAIAFTEATADRITTSFIDAVLELKVTPHITADRSVIMEIKVSRNAPQLSASTGSITGISKNETETEALVRDGETIVLGGIYVVDTGRRSLKVPFLADIPLLGAAFRNRSIDDERRELLIFVTPRVILGRASDA
jgi:type IV pilus assembly protein PilQ